MMHHAFGMDDPQRQEDSRRSGGFFAGLCAGAVVGTGVALLLAPRTGPEMRKQLADSATFIGSVVAKAAEALTQYGKTVAATGHSISQASQEIAYATDGVAGNVNRGLASLGELAAWHSGEGRAPVRS
jgi:gas vesicle protein